MKRKFRFLFLIPLILAVAGGILYLSQKIFWTKNQMFGCNCVNFEKATGDFDPNQKIAYFEGKQVTPLLAELVEPKQRVMGATAGEKWIEVILSQQKLIAWEGDNIYFETPVSSGKYFPTPEGEYNIWAKYKYIKMEGGVPGTGGYYNLPNVPYTMFFYKGFGIHGTYWHNNFGHPMSHGCVNVPTLAAEKLFYWATPALPSGKNTVIASAENAGTRVVIHQ